jgi:Zn-dependent protease with chaperone function
MTDFFGHQEQARRSTHRLVVLFGLAVLGIVAFVYLAAVAIFQFADARASLWQPEVLIATAAITILIVGAAAAFKTGQLRQGGPAVAHLLGGRPVATATTDPKERMLRNVVEEMAIASGVPVPHVFVLDEEEGLNAFAAGWGTADAAVAVTRGCLETLNRDELQGVVAHEFSHVFHGDMRLNIRLMGVLFGILCIAWAGEMIVRTLGRSTGSNRKGGAAAIVLFGVALLVIGWIGVFFARLIQAAVSRQREYLADASAVQYTRNPRGIGTALAKIGGLGARLRSPHAQEASHMLFADGVKRFFGGLAATHPPIEQRIERVLPGYLQQLRRERDAVAAVAATPLPPGAAGSTGTVGAIPAAAFVQSAGQPAAAHVQAARVLLQDLPMELAAALREPPRAAALVLALLLQRGEPQQSRQLALLQGRDAEFVHDVRAFALTLARLPPTHRLPLLELLVPALRQVDPRGRQRLRIEARAFAEADGVLSPFEFALLKTFERHVRLPGELPGRPAARPRALTACAGEVALVLSVLARAGHPDDEAAAAAAFAQGQARLPGIPASALAPAGTATTRTLESALDRLDAVSPLGKQNLLAACACAVGTDGRVAPDEADLLRALADHLGCPIPPVLANGQPTAS